MRGTKLHVLWDTGLIKSLNEAPEAVVHRLEKLSATYSKNYLEPTNAAEESCKVVLRLAGPATFAPN